MEYSPYQSGVSGQYGRYSSPSTSAEMARSPSGSSSTSPGSYTAASPWGSSDSPDASAPISPGGEITNESSYLDVSANNGGHQAYEYTEAANDCYQLQTSHHAPVQGVAESSSQDHSWYQFYDFIAKVEQGQSPYWRLKAEYTANEDYPMYRPCANSETTPRSMHLNVCLEPGCKSKPFRRKADLDRHYQQMHWDSSIKPSFPCDYPKCTRSANPFSRSDHYRDHCRDYHREDLLRRSSKRETNEWWADRVIHKKWWRCSKCLRRVYIQQHGFDCHNCKTPCESQRRSYRIHK
ncbi:hypothetical protein DL766_002103 [Monosporascus sp. MC13-8B]|uniref:C2H2-type domain-containing protein n=1 Tax=Monosporascus cannonballus TaxID=155416 RepID=A0ABY0H0Q6_9PEZI|nr:hypothetical protein DL762_006871 [Monosporascus cannonballus]RYO85445.1 hypothetical protein DL763_007081 [Monosporascus cannonballus]RYP36216.1 hypothetical protein DL766_002103 [Monosporascus sp. MC13-8B]